MPWLDCDGRAAAIFSPISQFCNCFVPSQSVGGTLRELLVYLLVYNLIRLAMLHGAAAQRADVDRLSFIDAMRYLAVRLLGLAGVDRLLCVPRRTARRQPRVIRRRMKEYDLLVEPRNIRIARENQS